MAVVGGVLGVGFGIGMSGRRAYNETNRAAKQVKTEVEEMHKTVTQIGTAVAISQQRAQAAQAGPAGLRPQADRGPGEGEARPPPRHLAHLHGRLLPDARHRGRQPDVLLLRHHRALRRGRAPRQEEQGRQGVAGGLRRQAEPRRARPTTASSSPAAARWWWPTWSRCGNPVCKGGGTDCPMDQLEGFEIRANSGATWVTRQVGPKPDGKHPGAARTDAAAGVGDGRLARSGAHGAVPAAATPTSSCCWPAWPRPRSSSSRPSTTAATRPDMFSLVGLRADVGL